MKRSLFNFRIGSAEVCSRHETDRLALFSTVAKDGSTICHLFIMRFVAGDRALEAHPSIRMARSTLPILAIVLLVAEIIYSVLMTWLSEV